MGTTVSISASPGWDRVNGCLRGYTDGTCFEFETEQAAIDFADSILDRLGVRPKTDDKRPVDSVVSALNAAFAVDPAAIHALLCNHVPCSRELADDPYVIVEKNRVVDGYCTIGALGILNGALSAAGIPRIGAKFEKLEGDRRRLVGFVVCDERGSG